MQAHSHIHNSGGLLKRGLPRPRRASRQDDVLAAIEWLKQCRSNAIDSASHALDYLGTLRGSVAILKIYRQFFPTLYRSSTASVFTPDKTWTSHSEREGEFFRLVSKRLFPLPGDGELDFYDEEQQQRFEQVPLTPLQGDSWCCGDVDPDTLRSVYYVALGLNASADFWESVVARYRLTADDPTPAERISYNRLRELCETEQTPLKHLMLPLELMQYETGNIWLDYSFCQSTPDLPWSVETLRLLAREYKEAQAAFNRVDELDRYIDEHPTKAVRRALELWNAAAGVTKKQ